MTWIVLGDSWSAICLNSLIADEFYKFEDSIFNRMREKFPKEIIHPWAECGSDALNQINRLSVGFKGQPLDDIKILWGWTDWTRCLGYDWDNRVYMTPDNMYDPAIQICYQKVQSEFVRLWNGIDNIHKVTVYHWGGKGRVWLEDMTRLRGTHHILYKDFPHECYNTPTNFAMSSHLDFQGWQSTLEIFPKSDRKLVKRWEKSHGSLSAYRNANPKQFPDRGHLAWNLYGPLIDKINNY